MSQQAYELLTLKDIFDSGKRQLSVPDYQRGYSWEEEQRKDLIDDIEQIIPQKNRRHFTGTVVASQNGDSPVFDLVDGQQRITSLVIFMASLIRVAKEKNMTALYSQPLINIKELYVCSGIATGNTCYQLQLGPYRDPLFHEVLIEGEPKTQRIKNKADQNIVDAAKQFESYLNIQETNSLEEIYRALTEKLGFLLYAPKEDAEIGIMFEVINNRGKPLSELEKIKNYLIYFAGRHGINDLKTKVNDNWPLLLGSLNKANYTSNDDENRFLRVCWIVFEDYNKSKSHHVYDNLKKVCPPKDATHWEKLSQFVKFITKAAQTYAYLVDSESSNLSNNEKQFLQRIALHPANASILPLVVALFSKENDPDKRATALDLLEKLNFRYYVSGIATRNDSGQGELFEMAYDYYKGNFSEQENPNDLSEIDFLHNKITRFVEREANDYKFVQYLTLDKNEAGDYYNWQGLKYFLGSYEDSLLDDNKQSSNLSKFLAQRKKESPNDFYHREHIWARKECSIVNDKNDLNINKRRLGNFIILMPMINISVGNHRIEDKVEKYFGNHKAQPNTNMIRLLKEDFDKAVQKIDDSRKYTNKVKNYWYLVYQNFLDIREQHMINFAIKRWAVDGINRPVKSVVIDSERNDNEIFTCLPDYKSDTDKIIDD